MESTLAFRNSATARSSFFNKAIRNSGNGDSGSGDSGNSGNGATGDVAAAIDEIYAILTAQLADDARVLDASLADYVFFPLLTVLQSASEPPRPDSSNASTPSTPSIPSIPQRPRFTARAVESAARCTRLLIQSGWKTGISKDTAQRLLLVLAGLADASTTGFQAGTAPEELVVEAYRSLAALLRTAAAAPSSPLTDTATIPVLAHAITLLLTAAADAVLPALQTEALNGVAALYTTVQDLEALASFLPGTVSALVRVVAQPGAHKTPRRVLVRALEVLFAVISNTLGDLPTRRIAKISPAEADPSTPVADEEVISDSVAATDESTKSGRMVLNASWLHATAAQVKVALSAVLKLRTHESDDVRDAVHRFCVGLLDECHASLAESASMLVESAIVTARPADPDAASISHDRTPASMTATTLENLAILYPELGDAIATAAYHWAADLPRAMQAGEERAKQRALHNLQAVLAVLDTLQLGSATLHASLAGALRDSVVTLIRTESGQPGANAAVEAVSDDVLALTTTGSGTTTTTGSPSASSALVPYKPVVLALGSQRDTRAAVLDLLAHIGPPAHQARLAAEMLDAARDAAAGLDQVAAYWLSFELVKAAARAEKDEKDETDSFLDLTAYADPHATDAVGAVLDDLYAYSVSLLATYSESSYDAPGAAADWRSGALALEVTAYAAARAQDAFRPELIDVLYPIATHLGAPQPQLRAHAIQTLNSIAASCGYADGSVAELIVDNVDYMLNAVSLRLNTFDISSASTQVLRMMVRLAGPRLVPYLDDVVASIFAALDNYHGYPLFVESLFGVLGEIVQQSVRPQARALLEAPSSQPPAGRTHRKRLAPAPSTDDLVSVLERRAKRRKEALAAADDDVEEVVRGHPKRPWGELRAETGQAETGQAKTLMDEMGLDDDGDGDGDGDGGDGAKEPPKPHDDTKPEDPKTPMYALLARITTLTQHYLTSPTPALRKSLLDLLATVAPALGSADEGAFLPLVNAIWPVVVPRLFDTEPYVAVAACHALAALAASAGDFLSSRIKDAWWPSGAAPGLGAWCARTKAAALRAAKAPPGKPTHKTPLSRTLYIGSRPSVTHMHGRASAQKHVALPDVVTPGASALAALSSSPASSEPKSQIAPAGLGRFAQAVQLWEAVVELFTALVAHVRLDDAVLDAIVDLLQPDPAAKTSVLSRDVLDKAYAALDVVNPDAVWLMRLRGGEFGPSGGNASGPYAWLAHPPVLEGIHFVPLP